MHIYLHITAYSKFIYIFRSGKYSITWNQLSSCLNSSQGNEWQHQMAVWTRETHQIYTPWITLNGQHSVSIQHECESNTLSCTCQEYTGTNSCCNEYKLNK